MSTAARQATAAPSSRRAWHATAAMLSSWEARVSALHLEPQLLVRVGRLSSPLHGFPRRLEAGRQAALASPRHGGTARGGRCLARPRTGGGRYFIYRPPRVPVSRSISIQRTRLSKGGRVQAGRWLDRALRRPLVVPPRARAASPASPSAAVRRRRAPEGRARFAWTRTLDYQLISSQAASLRPPSGLTSAGLRTGAQGSCNSGNQTMAARVRVPVSLMGTNLIFGCFVVTHLYCDTDGHLLWSLNKAM